MNKFKLGFTGLQTLFRLMNYEDEERSMDNLKQGVDSGDTDLKNITLGTPMMKLEQMIAIRSNSEQCRLSINVELGKPGRDTVYGIELKNESSPKPFTYKGRDLEGGLRVVIQDLEFFTNMTRKEE